MPLYNAFIQCVSAAKRSLSAELIVMPNFTRSYEDNGLWGICGTDGMLYTGSWHTRKEAIDAHVMALFGTLDSRAKDWEKCRAKGDRATKLRIIYEWKA